MSNTLRQAGLESIADVAFFIGRRLVTEIAAGREAANVQAVQRELENACRTRHLVHALTDDALTMDHASTCSAAASRALRLLQEGSEDFWLEVCRVAVASMDIDIRIASLAEAN